MASDGPIEPDGEQYEPPPPPHYEPPRQPPPPVGQPSQPPPPVAQPPYPPRPTPQYEPPIGYEPEPATAYDHAPPAVPTSNQPPAPPSWVEPNTVPAPPGKQRRGIGTTVRIVLALFLVLTLGIAACTVWFVTTLKAPVDVSNNFLGAIDRGDYEGALDYTDAGCSNGMTALDIDRVFLGGDLDYNLTGSSVSSGRATATGSLDLNGDPQPGVEVYLRKRNDDWRVCGFAITAPTTTLGND